jgi:uroporphyrinogen-III synthase
MPDQALSGVGVLVTRPLSQAQDLVDAIEAHGGIATCFPVIEIVPRDAAELAASVASLQDPDVVIFVSRNAVRFGLASAANGLIAAVGPATAAAVEACGRKVDVLPSSGFDSEHLLAEPALTDVANKTVRIVRGSDGRDLIANTLRERGARVEYLSVYTRQIPEYSDAELDALESRWRAGRINVVTVMSVESAKNLEALLPTWCADQIKCGSLVAPAARVLKEALTIFPGTSAVQAAGPLASDMVNAIIELGNTAPGQS